MASISTRTRADGTTAWRVQFRTHRGGTPTTETFDTEREAAAFAALVDRIGGAAARAKRDALTNNTHTTPTIGGVLEDYLAQAIDITPGTAAEYRRIYDRSGLATRLGAIPVSLIDRRDIEAWIHDRSTTPSSKTRRLVSTKTLRNEHGLAFTLLEHALTRGWIDKNPAKGTRLPRRPREELIIPTDSQLKAVTAALSPRYQPLVLFLAATGLRWGEATALEWGDLTGDTVTVRRAWKHGETGRVLGAPKTRRAHRTISTSPALLAALGPRGRDDMLVFTNGAGRPVLHTTFWQSHWRPAVEAAKILPAPRIHDLRHYAASHMLTSGADLFEVSRALGHESLTTTSDLYGHLVPGRTRPTVQHAETVLMALTSS